MDGNVDVIVTDGFTGNVALKTAEGTANFITSNLKKSLNKFSILYSYKSLKKFKEKLDPRKYNGAIFLGLESPVVKSHGGTDSIGFAHSINVCNKIVNANLIESKYFSSGQKRILVPVFLIPTLASTKRNMWVRFTLSLIYVSIK